MCGRTTLFAPAEDVEDRFDATFSFDYEPRYNISPGAPGLPTIRNESEGDIEQLYWGLVPDWVEELDDWAKPINARAESLTEKPTFRQSFNERRCLIIADGFYEWGGPQGRRRPFRFTVDDGTPFAMAGLWAERRDASEKFASVTVITTEPNDVVAPVHDRMPVILAPREETTWLADPEIHRLERVLSPCSSERMEKYEVSRAVNDPANDAPTVVEPVGSSQSGLDEF